MENIYQGGSNNLKLDYSRRESSTSGREVKIDYFKVVAPILEDILERIQGKKAEQVISEFYIGASQLWGDIDSWPQSIKKFYGQLNYKVNNPESTACIESRDRMVERAIKNKWLSTTGVSFKGRYERLKQLGEKNIREDGTKIGTKAIEFRTKGKIEIEFKPYVKKKDYKVKGIETNGEAKRFKVLNVDKEIKDLNKDEKQLVDL